MSPPGLSDDELIRQLEACTLPETSFHHLDHVRAAWVYLNRLPALEAVARFSAALRAYAVSLGKAGRYHETITWAYLFLIHVRVRSGPPGTWDEFVKAHPDLCDWKSSILLSYYRKETLDSPLAREIFLLPDAGFVPPRAR